VRATNEPNLDVASMYYEYMSVIAASASASTSTSSACRASDDNGTAAAASHPAHSGGNPTMGNSGVQLTEKGKADQNHLALMLQALVCQLQDDLMGKTGTSAQHVRLYGL